MTAKPEPVDLLREVPLLASFGAEARARLAHRAELVHLPARRWLFRRGDPARSCYLVLAGRLEVVGEDDEVIRVLGPGAAVGELALLTGAPRSASARARRDTELLEIPRADFEALLEESPEFGLALARDLGRQLQRSRGVAAAAPGPPTTIAVVGDAERTPVRAFADALTAALRRWGEVVAMTRDSAPGGAGGLTEAGAAVNTCERERVRVVLVAERLAAGDAWTDFAVREADRAILLARPGDSGLRGHPCLADADLVVIGSGPRMPGWAGRCPARALHRCAGESALGECAERLARRAAGRAVGLVLSGGGARAFAHLGVIDELAARGAVVDRVAGTSMGSFIGAHYAAGLGPDEIAARCREMFVERNPLGDYTIPLVSLARGRRARAVLRRQFGDRNVEDLDREFLCVSCDLVSAELVAHRRGSLVRALGASMSLPGIAPPVPHEGRLLVDGGVLNNMPVDILAATPEGPLIAVDVSASFAGRAVASQGRPGRRGRAAARLRAALVGTRQPLPNLKEILARAITLGSMDTAMAAERHADLAIRPDIVDVGLLQFERLDEVRAEGRRAARAALDVVGGVPGAS